MSAEVIDFTAEALHRKWETAYANGAADECAILSALIEGYLDGLWTVKWQEGEPMFTATGKSAGSVWDKPEVQALMGLCDGASLDDS